MSVGINCLVFDNNKNADKEDDRNIDEFIPFKNIK